MVFTSLVKSSVQYNSPTGLDSYWEQGSRMGFTKRNSFAEDCVRYGCECLTHLSVHLWIALAYKAISTKARGVPFSISQCRTKFIMMRLFYATHQCCHKWEKVTDGQCIKRSLSRSGRAAGQAMVLVSREWGWPQRGTWYHTVLSFLPVQQFFFIAQNR